MFTDKRAVLPVQTNSVTRVFSWRKPNCQRGLKPVQHHLVASGNLAIFLPPPPAPGDFVNYLRTCSVGGASNRARQRRFARKAPNRSKYFPREQLQQRGRITTGVATPGMIPVLVLGEQSANCAPRHRIKGQLTQTKSTTGFIVAQNNLK